jgi:uncharacterized membrane protein YoaK (UPF0700 family)
MSEASASTRAAVAKQMKAASERIHLTDSKSSKPKYRVARETRSSGRKTLNPQQAARDIPSAIEVINEGSPSLTLSLVLNRLGVKERDPMFKHTLQNQVSPKVIAHWLLLTFIAGQLNAAGLLACSRFVSHVTGFATQAGVELSQAHFKAAFGSLLVPGFFMLGAMISGFMIEARLRKKQKPLFARVLLIAAWLVLVVMVLGHQDYMTAFDGASEIHRGELALLALLCLISGLLNGAITNSSKGTIRCTHLTGLTTDLGIGISRLLTYEKAHESIPVEKSHFRRRLLQLLSFVLGSFTGALLFQRYAFIGFTPVLVLLLYLAWVERE